MGDTWKKRNELLAKAQNIQRLANADMTVTLTGVKGKFAVPADVAGLYQLTTEDAQPCMFAVVPHSDVATSVSLFTVSSALDDGRWVTTAKVDIAAHALRPLDDDTAYLFTPSLTARVWTVVDALTQLNAVVQRLQRQTTNNGLLADTTRTTVTGKVNEMLRRGR